MEDYVTAQRKGMTAGVISFGVRTDPFIDSDRAKEDYATAQQKGKNSGIISFGSCKPPERVMADFAASQGNSITPGTISRNSSISAPSTRKQPQGTMEDFVRLQHKGMVHDATPHNDLAEDMQRHHDVVNRLISASATGDYECKQSDSSIDHLAAIGATRKQQLGMKPGSLSVTSPDFTPGSISFNPPDGMKGAPAMQKPVAVAGTISCSPRAINARRTERSMSGTSEVSTMQRQEFTPGTISCNSSGVSACGTDQSTNEGIGPVKLHESWTPGSLKLSTIELEKAAAMQQQTPIPDRFTRHFLNGSYTNESGTREDRASSSVFSCSDLTSACAMREDDAAMMQRQEAGPGMISRNFLIRRAAKEDHMAMQRLDVASSIMSCSDLTTPSATPSGINDKVATLKEESAANPTLDRHGASPDGHSVSVSPGVRVVLIGLMDQSMNGLAGVVIGWHEEERRWKVSLDNGVRSLVKPSNVRVARGDPVKSSTAIAQGDSREDMDLRYHHGAGVEGTDPNGNREEILSAGMPVIVFGLKIQPELNGQKGILKVFDQQLGRWKVQMDDGSGKMFKANNLKPLHSAERNPAAPIGDYTYNGSSKLPKEEPGVSEKASGRQSIFGSQKNIEIGARVRVVGLTMTGDDSELSGIVECWDDQLQRWKIRTGNGSSKAFRPENLHVEGPEVNGAANKSYEHIAQSQKHHDDPRPVATHFRRVTSEPKLLDEIDLGPGILQEKGHRIMVQHLRKGVELNGQTGTLLEFDDNAQRWKVHMDNGKGLLLKPSNLQVLDPHLVPRRRVLISGTSDPPHLNGQQGVLLGWDVGAERWKVLMDDKTWALVKPEHLMPADGNAGEAAHEEAVATPISPGVRVEMRGIEASGRLGLNGVRAIVEKVVNRDGEEWAKLRMADGTRKRVRVRKLVVVTEDDVGAAAHTVGDAAQDVARTEKASDTSAPQPLLRRSNQATVGAVTQDVARAEIAPDTSLPQRLLRRSNQSDLEIAVDVTPTLGSPRPEVLEATLPAEDHRPSGAESPEQKKVFLTMLVHNVDYALLSSHFHLRHCFEQKVRDAIAAESDEVEPEHVSVTLSEGCLSPKSPFAHWPAPSPVMGKHKQPFALRRSSSRDKESLRDSVMFTRNSDDGGIAVQVDAVVAPPPGVTAKTVYEALSSSRSICQLVAACIKTVPQMAGMSKGDIHASVASISSDFSLTHH